MMLMMTIGAISAFADNYDAGHFHPTGGTSTYYAYTSSECNRTINVTFKDTGGSTVRKVVIHTKHGVDATLGMYLCGYDIVGFSSNQSVLETCKMGSTSGCGTCTGSYLYIYYYFRTALSKSELNVTVTVRKWDPVSFEVRHYVEKDPTLNNFHRDNYQLHSTTNQQSLNYYASFSVSKKTITGYTLRSNYNSTVSGNLCFYQLAGATQNTPSSPRCYSYDLIQGTASIGSSGVSSYSESSDGTLRSCSNRKYWVEFFYDRNEYTISYNANGGSGAPSSQKKYYGVSTTLSTTKPTRNGYTFKGWGTGSTSTTPSYQPGGTYTGNASRTLYAVWESDAPKTYTVSYNANGGYNAPGKQTKTHGAALMLSSSIPTRSGYTFLGWGTSSSSTSVSYASGGRYTTNADITLYAVWQKNPETYTVTYDANGGSGAPSTQIKTEGVALTLSSTIPIRSGYTFLGWNMSQSAILPIYYAGGVYTFDASVTLYAVWEYVPPVTYTISFDENGGSGAPASVIKTDGVTLYLPTTVPTRFNYAFRGWSTDSTATTATYSSGSSFTKNEDTTLYAVWEYDPVKYSVSYSANGGSGAPATQNKTHGVELTLSTVQPIRSGYDFMGWATSSSSTSVSYAPGDSYSDDADITLYAVWQLTNYDFSISNLTFSRSDPYKYDQITVKVRVDNWDKIHAYAEIPVQLYYDDELMCTQYVDLAVYGVANIMFTLNVGGAVGDKTIEARINWAAHDSETRTENNAVSSAILVRDFDYDVSVDPVTVTGNYCEGMDVITSFYVLNNSDYDITPDMHNTARFVVYYYNGSNKVEITTQDWADVVVPAGGTNLVYFKWQVPAGLNGKTVYLECTVNADCHMNEENYDNNTMFTTATVSSINRSQTPDTRFESVAPNSYGSAAVPSVSTNHATWTMWEYVEGGFVLKKYGVQISEVSPVVTPGGDYRSAVYAGGKWIMRSGYGIEINYTPAITVVGGYSMPQESAYTSVQNVIATFPEYRYMETNGKCRTLVYADGSFRFVENGNADSNARVHFIPVYVKDGLYTVSVTATHVWTPAGMIEAVRNANGIIIDGTVYDDWYQG